MPDKSHWAPVLPTCGGRRAPRVYLPPHVMGGTYQDKLSWYYLERNSSPSVFIHNVDNSFLRRAGREDLCGRSLSLEDLPSDLLYRYLIGMFPRGKVPLSENFQRKLSGLCAKGQINTIRRWYQTVDGLVLPLLLTVPDPDKFYPVIDGLIKFGFENCANNYSHFISRMKTLKRLMRKDYALRQDSSLQLNDCRRYLNAYKLAAAYAGTDSHAQVEVLLCWSQTRACGLADSRMKEKSLRKAEETLSTVRRTYLRPGSLEDFESRYDSGSLLYEPRLDREVLEGRARSIASRVDGRTCHISAGPHSCLEFRQARGGQTEAITQLTKNEWLHRVFNPIDLSSERVDPRPVRSVGDLLSWAIQEALEHPTYVRCCRLVAVEEPSKARTITVGTLPYQIIVGAVAKLLQPAIEDPMTLGGLRSTRNLYEFLNRDLDPGRGLWGYLRDKTGKGDTIYALSSDLEEATDYGDLAIARQVLHAILWSCRGIEGFPMGLCLLAKTLYLGKRFIFRLYERRGVYRHFVKRSGWLMGDRLTKVVLTVSHEVGIRSLGLNCARICGDDVVALSKDRKPLDLYREFLELLGFKISEDDHYVSSRLMFYCEEGATVPQGFRELPAVCNRRNKQSCYVDYPRIRLLISAKMETHPSSYTDFGRFSLLGKETRWVHQNCPPRTHLLFWRAALLQHLLVPRTKDTLCPFIPEQIGGDGSFPENPEFLHQVILRKSYNPQEVAYRMVALLRGKWGYKYVRMDHTNSVIQKYHMMVPHIEGLEKALQVHCPDAIVGADEFLLGSIKTHGLEVPEKTFFRFLHAHYWRDIFDARKPMRLRFDRSITRSEAGGRGCDLSKGQVSAFFRTWRDLGFTFRDKPTYLLRTDKVQCHDYMNLGFTFRGTGGLPADPAGGGVLTDEHLLGFIAHLQNGDPLPMAVKDRMSTFVEADSYLMHRFSRWPEYPEAVFLVSKDQVLARNLARIASESGKPGASRVEIYMVDPEDYQEGRMGLLIRNLRDFSWIPDPDFDPRIEDWTLVDFGAMEWLSLTRNPTFLESAYYTVATEPITQKGAYSERVTHIRYWADSAEGVTWSLTTQGSEQWSDRPVIRGRAEALRQLLLDINLADPRVN